MPDVKFCGLTREEDAVEAARLGARYAGLVLTESPRRLSVANAARLRDTLRGSPIGVVGVFGREADDEVLSMVERTRVDVVQLHGGATPDLTARLRESFGVEVWQVVRVGQGPGSAKHAELNGADGVLLDTLSAGALGGTGSAFDWSRAVDDSRRWRIGRRLIVAGGLRPENVGEAIRLLAPDVVDVSSGVESSPGVKDHARMAAFVAAVHSAASVVES